VSKMNTYYSYNFLLEDAYKTNLSLISINNDKIAIEKLREFITVYRSRTTNKLLLSKEKIILNKKCIGENKK